MSQFSNLISQFIKDSPYSVKKLANNCNVDRTVIQKYISGERLPNSYKNIEKIINKLTLTKTQKIHLRKAYDIEKLGIEKYQHLIRLKKIIENINFSNQNHVEIHYNFDVIHPLATSLEELIIITQYIINDVIHSNSKKIKVCIPTNNILYQTITDILVITPQIFMEQILHLENDHNNYKNTMNLIQFENCFSLLFFKNIIVKYNYDNFISSLSQFVSYPYMINSENYSLLIDSQLSSGILLTNEMNQHLNYQFDNIFNNAQLYNNYMSSLFGYLQFTNEFVDAPYYNHCILANEPSIISVIDTDLLKRHFIGEKNDYDKIEKYFLNYKTYINNLTQTKMFHIFFTKSGLQSFINTGLTHEFPKKYMNSLSIKECILILKRLINITNNNHNYKLHLIHEEYFVLPQQCIISYQENNNAIITVEKDNQNVCCIINELTIKKEFYNLKQLIKIEEYEYNEDYIYDYLQHFIEKTYDSLYSDFE